MCKNTETRKDTELEFSHFVVDSSEGSIIGFSNGSVYKILMGTGTAWIKILSIDQWLELPRTEAERIRNMASESFGKVPVHRVPRFIL